MKMSLQLASVVLGLSLSMGCGKKATPSSTSSTGNAAGTSATNNGVSSEDASSGNSANGGFDASKIPVIYFDYDQASINDEGRTKLQTIATTLKGKKAKLTIEGHCDERGSNEYNLALGERRSQAVKSYLQKLGVASDHVAAISYGEERPAVNSAAESAWSKNRRAEIVVSQ